jgi:hypothetical protein
MVQWARRYAKSRTISFLVQWVFIVVMVLVVAIAATLTNTAYQQGNLMLTYASVTLMCVVMLLLMWFSMSRWGGELIFRITQWFYGREGYVSYDEEHGTAPRSPWLMTALGGGLVGFHLLGAMLVSLNYLSLRNMQPFSAIYMVPFLCYMIWAQGLGIWAWIWPVLYGVHGILLFTDVFPKLPPNYTFLHMIVPVFGYGLVAIVTGHLYSRYALWRLKRLARTGLGDGGTVEEDEDETS